MTSENKELKECIQQKDLSEALLTLAKRTLKENGLYQHTEVTLSSELQN